MSFRTLSRLVIGLCPLWMGLNCIQQPKTTDTTPKARTSVTLRGFSSPDELRNYLADQAQAATSPRSGTGGGGGLFSFLTPLAGGAAPAALTEGAAASDSSNSNTSGSTFSSTNIQEDGVD